MKTLWIYGLWSLLAIVAYSGISVGVSTDVAPLSEARASPSVAALPPSLQAPVGVIAGDASYGDSRNPDRSTAAPAPGSMHSDDNAATNLSAYVLLHETRNISNPLQVAPRANVCPD